MQEPAAARRRAHGRLSGLSQRRPRHHDFCKTARTCRWWSRPTDWPPARGCSSVRRRAEAIEAVKRIGRNREFGDAGNQIVIEERLDGQEASVLAITDGRTIVTLPPAQDHKRAYDGDTGPNTGGMGAYCPAPLVTDEMLHRIEEQVLVPTVHAMKRARRPFQGVLYAGLMITNQGPEGAGIQRPLRRSRMPAAADAACRAIWPTCWKRPSTAGWTSCRRSSGIRGRPCAW